MPTTSRPLLGEKPGEVLAPRPHPKHDHVRPLDHAQG